MNLIHIIITTVLFFIVFLCFDFLESKKNKGHSFSLDDVEHIYQKQDGKWVAYRLIKEDKIDYSSYYFGNAEEITKMIKEKIQTLEEQK